VRLDRAGDPTGILTPHDSAIFYGCLVILLYRQPFCYNELSYLLE
jgi:hypothetical protein